MEIIFSKLKDPKYYLRLAIVALVYFLSAKFGLSLAYSVKQVTLVWPPTGISLALVFIFGFDLWPGIIIGAFIANLTTHETIAIASLIAVGNTFEALVGAYLLKLFKFRRSFERITDVFIFIIFAAAFSTLVSAGIGTASLIFGGIGSWKNYFSVASSWWIGDLLGDMVVAPFVLVWSEIAKVKLSVLALFEGVLFFILILFVSLILFTGVFPFSSFIFQVQFKYLIFPLLLLVAYRFKQKGSTLFTLLVACVALWGAVSGTGPFIVSGNPELGLFYMGVFVASISFTFLTFSSVIEERDSGERRFRSLIENSSDAIIVVDSNAIINYASQSVERVIGYKPNELIGSDGFKLIYEEDIKNTKEVFGKLLQNPGKTLSLDNRLIRKDGKVRWMEAEGLNLLYDSSVGGIVVNFRDINDRMQLDQVKSEFVSLSAHQLRTPLSVARWYSEAVMKTKSLPKNLMENLTEIHSAVMTMTDTVNLLLEVSRFELGTVHVSGVSLDLHNIVRDILSSEKKAISEHELKVSVSKEKIPEIIGDPKLIGVIIENLVSNAIKYTPKGGSIDISLVSQTDNILFKIKDTGVGIPVEDQPQIFTKLFRSDNVKKIEQSGLGLGLYLVRLVVDLKGGKIWFESEEGKGTTFFVEFPKKVKNK